MKVFRDLIIEYPGTIDELTDLIVVEIEDSNWERSEDFDIRDGTVTSPITCFQYSGEIIDQHARLFIANKEEDTFYVSNIVPENGSLTHDEYNNLIDSFYETINNIRRRGVTDISRSTDEIIFEEVVPENIQRAFFSFSRAANKSTGSAHPMDKERWYKFICLIYREQYEMNHDLMKSKLIEDGWSEDKAFDLLIEFEFGLGLLKHCN